jgi:hypothetical protein
MRLLIVLIGIVGLVAPAFADVPGGETPRGTFLTSFPGFQLGGWGDEDEGGSGGGDWGGSGDKRLSLALCFGLIFPKSEQAYDIDSSSARPPDWTYFYQNGLAGYAKLSYTYMPALRFGGGLGFEYFQDRDREYPYTFLGTDYVDTEEPGDMSMLYAGIHVDFMIPINLATGAWFNSKEGPVQGAVPYIGWEGATVYRTRVRWEYFDDWSDTTFDMEFMRPYFTFVNGLRGGVEFRMEGFGFFVEAAYLWYTPPKKGKDLWWRWRWDWMVAAPIRGGIVLYF